MKNYFLADYLGCILFKALGPVLRVLPIELSFFLGRRLGDCFYYFDLKHRARAYANIKFALGSSLSPAELSRLTKSFYQSFGQSIIEVFLIPLVDRNYMAKIIYLIVFAALVLYNRSLERRSCPRTTSYNETGRRNRRCRKF